MFTLSGLVTRSNQAGWKGFYMTNAQHTPGPWLVTDENLPHGPKPTLITYLGVPIGKALDNCDSVEETYANARLIAAAPELLAACIAALPFLTRLHADTYKQVFDAIAKARGAEAPDPAYDPYFDTCEKVNRTPLSYAAWLSAGKPEGR